jgi:hypothetical protein
MSEMAMRGLAYPDEEAVAQRDGLENFTLQGGRPIVWQTGDLSMPEGYEELTRSAGIKIHHNNHHQMKSSAL